MKYIKINFFFIFLIINTNTAKSAEKFTTPSPTQTIIKYEYCIENINYQNNDGDTQLTSAISTHDDKLVEELLQIKHIDLNLQNKLGRSALHLATINQNPLLITSLIEAGANPMLRNQRGATIAFFTHAINQNKLTVPIFKKIISAKDEEGNTHLHILAVADIKGMAKKSPSKSRRHVLSTLLNHLTDGDISIWELNNKKEWAVETAYKKFQKCKKQYENDKKIQSRKRLRTQELILHVFLLHYVKSEKNQALPIRDLFFQDFNLETEIARRHENDPDYYQSKYNSETIEKEKNDLRNNTTITWVSTSSPRKKPQLETMRYVNLPHCAYS